MLAFIHTVMYRRAVLYKMQYPLRPDGAGASFRGAKKVRRVGDKNRPDSWIELPCSLERAEKDGNYTADIGTVHQLRARSDMEYQEVTGNLALVFILGKKILAAMGRDGIGKAVSEVSKALYPGVDEDVFLPVQFDRDSVMDAIRRLRRPNTGSWRHSLAGRLAAKAHNGKRSLGFSKDEGVCILDDSEAMDAISNATSVSPRYKFYKCKELGGAAYDGPKPILFNAGSGTVSVSVRQESDNMYMFMTGFLAKSLKVFVR